MSKFSPKNFVRSSNILLRFWLAILIFSLPLSYLYIRYVTNERTDITLSNREINAHGIGQQLTKIYSVIGWGTIDPTLLTDTQNEQNSYETRAFNALEELKNKLQENNNQQTYSFIDVDDLETKLTNLMENKNRENATILQDEINKDLFELINESQLATDAYGDSNYLMKISYSILPEFFYDVQRVAPYTTIPEGQTTLSEEDIGAIKEIVDDLNDKYNTRIEQSVNIALQNDLKFHGPIVEMQANYYALYDSFIGFLRAFKNVSSAGSSFPLDIKDNQAALEASQVAIKSTSSFWDATNTYLDDALHSRLNAQNREFVIVNISFVVLLIIALILASRIAKEINKQFKEIIRLQYALASANDPVLVVKPNGEIIYCNNSATENMINLQTNVMNFVGQNINDHLKFSKDNQEYKFSVVADNVVNGQANIFDSVIGDKIFQFTISQSSSKGRDYFFVLIGHDTTVDKAIDKAKTEFVSLASHQLRTPLTAVRWYTELLIKGQAGQLTAPQQKFMAEINSSNNRMIALVDDFLNVSRIEVGDFSFKTVSAVPSEIIKQVIDEAKPSIISKKQQLLQSIQQNMPEMMLDDKKILDVFQNLLSNAIKYTPEGGTISVALALGEIGTKIGKQVVGQKSLLFMVRDTGMGITKQQQDKIFSKLFRADNVKKQETEGTGLGLYYIKSIVDRAHGQIWFESEEGRGTTFYVVIPENGFGS